MYVFNYRPKKTETVGPNSTSKWDIHLYQQLFINIGFHKSLSYPFKNQSYGVIEGTTWYYKYKTHSHEFHLDQVPILNKSEVYCLGQVIIYNV